MAPADTRAPAETMAASSSAFPHARPTTAIAACFCRASASKVAGVARQQMDDATLKRQGKGRGCLNLKTCKLRKSSSNQQVWYQGLRYSDCKRAHTALQPWSPDLKNNVPAFQQPHKGRDGAR